VRSDFRQKNVVQFTTEEGLAHEIKCLREVVSNVKTKADEERVLMEEKLDKLQLKLEQSLLVQMEMMTILRSTATAAAESLAVSSVGPVCTKLYDHIPPCSGHKTDIEDFIVNTIPCTLSNVH
jgi:hypothetical protein